MRRHATYSTKFVLGLMLLMLVIGVAIGVVLKGTNPKVRVRGNLTVKNTGVDIPTRTQVKFLPFPPTKMIKTATIVWIDAGWDVVGSTDTHLILKMGGGG